MTHVFRIQSNRQVASFQFNGKMTVSDGADIFLAYVRAQGFNSLHPMLCDARGVTEIDASFLSIFTRVARLAPELRSFREPVNSAVLVNSDTVFGYVRMVEQILDMTTKIRMHAVWTEDEALDLVGHKGADFATFFA
jgi:hypothetical protein